MPVEKPIFQNKHYNTPGHAHELTFSCYRRQRYFNDDTLCEVFLEELQRVKEKHLFKIWAYVIMPNHVHLLIWPQETVYDIGKIMRVLKSKSALRSSKVLKDIEKTVNKETEFRFWQHGGGFDRNLWNGLAIHNAIAYIENNPVRSGLATSATEWRWSSAHARVVNKGLVPDVYKIPVLVK
jgi:putative transposase